MDEPSILTDHHLMLFGSIAQWFAQYELTMQRAIAGMLRIEVSSAVLLTRELDFTQKRATLLDLVKERALPDDSWERIFAYLAIPTTRALLRDQIMHSTWRKSPEPTSIQPNWILRLPPGIEPTYRSPISDDSSYSVDLLGEIVRDLAENHERFVTYLVEEGLISA